MEKLKKDLEPFRTIETLDGKSLIPFFIGCTLPRVAEERPINERDAVRNLQDNEVSKLA